MPFDHIHREEGPNVGEPEDDGPGEVAGVGPPCDECGTAEAVETVAGRDLCGSCADAERDGNSSGQEEAGDDVGARDGGDDTDGPDSADDRVEVRSPYRPLPREARKRLREMFDTVEFIDGGDDGRDESVMVPERPPEDFLEQYELEVRRDPTVTYETPNGEVYIYTDPGRVVAEGVETNMDPVVAVERSEEKDYFTLKSGDPADVTAPGGETSR